MVSDAVKAALLSEATAQLEKYAEDHHIADEWCLKPNGTVILIPADGRLPRRGTPIC